MKCSGHLLTFSGTNFTSIYKIVKDDKFTVSRSFVTAEINDKLIFLQSFWNGYEYEIKLSETKANNYSGEIFRNKEKSGKIYLTKLTNNSEDVVLIGDYIEDEISYDCFIKLKAVKEQI